MHIVNFDPNHRGAAQGDLYLFKLTDAEAAKRCGVELKKANRGSIRLLEGEVTGHHHEIVQDHEETGGTEEASAIAAAALGIAKARAAAARGTATLYQDDNLAAALPWLRRRDLMIGFLVVTGGPVILRHPEHDAVKLPEGTFYVGRQIESAGAEERVVSD